MHATRRGWLLIVLSATSYGGVAVLGKLALADGIAVSALLFWRWLLAFTALLAVVAAARRVRLPVRVAGAAFAVGAVGNAGTSGLYFLALPSVPAAVASFLLFLSPVLVAAAAAFLLRERVTGRLVLALAGSVAGLGLLAFAPGVEAAPAGVAFALAAAGVYAATILASRRVVAAHEPLPVALWAMAGATASFGTVAVASGSFTTPADPRAWAVVATLAVVSTAVSVAAFYLALPLLGAARTALGSMLEPVTTVGVAWVVLGEPFLGVQVVGGALVLGSVALVASEPTADARDAPPTGP